MPYKFTISCRGANINMEGLFDDINAGIREATAILKTWQNASGDVIRMGEVLKLSTNPSDEDFEQPFTLVFKDKRKNKASGTLCCYAVDEKLHNAFYNV